MSNLSNLSDLSERAPSPESGEGPEPQGSQPWIAMTTLPSHDSAHALAQALVEGRWAGCVQVVPGLTSHYRFEGRLHADSEYLLLIKTTRGAWPRLRAELLAQHPYEVPELLAWPAQGWSFPYAAWLSQAVAEGAGGA